MFDVSYSPDAQAVHPNATAASRPATPVQADSTVLIEAMLHQAQKLVSELDFLSVRDRKGTWIMPLVQARRLRDELQRLIDFGGAIRRPGNDATPAVR